MSETREYTVYTFDELSDTAKDRARDWYRRGVSEDFATDFGAEFVTDDAVRVARILGIEIRTRTVRLMNGNTRQEPTIYWTGFGLQGDGACFEGRYRYNPGACREIRAYAPQDTDLHVIADTLRDLQRPYFYGLYADLTQRRSSHYYHEHTVDIAVDCDTRTVDAATCESVADELRDFMRWIYRRLETEYDYQSSDEVVDESIRANGYTFDEHGNQED